MRIEPPLRRRSCRGALLLLGALLWGAPAFGQTCDVFSIVPSPSPDPNRSVLFSVTGTSSTDAWALGSMGDPGVPLLIRWDGTEWAPRPIPAVPSGTTLGALGATPDGDTWLGGEGPRPLPGTPGNPVLARARNGAFNRIDEVELPPQTVYPHWPRGGTPIEIDGTSATDVWVALEAMGNGDGTGTIIPSVLHFDGSSWTETQLPRRSNLRSHPRGIEAIAPNDVWVAGYGRSNGTAFFGEVFHYDGSSWSYVPTPLENTGQVFFLDVSASGPNDVWVVGYINYTTPIYLHYDGSGWTEVPGPASAVPVRVIALAPDNAWASPYALHDADAYFHWNGTAWTEVAGPHPPGATEVRRGTDLAKVGPCEAWSVGYYAAGTPRRTLTERLGGSGAPAVAVSAQPVSPPVVIPPQGGRFTYRVTLTNTTAQPQTVQAWTAVTGPVSREPVVGPQTVTLPPGASVVRTLTQRVPGNAPAGTYTYHVRLGTFGGTVTASDSFSFTKQAGVMAATRGGSAADWATSGWDGAAAGLPGGFVLSEAHPNPFTLQTTLTLEVAEAQAVRAAAYDALGRRVAVLLDGAVEAGVRALVLDGASLPAGVYVVHVAGETFAATRRVTLVR